MDWLMSNLTLANFATDAMDIWRGNGERKKERGRKREKERKKKRKKEREILTILSMLDRVI